MAEIEFTQYLRPDGRKQPCWIDRPDDVANKAQEIVDAGFRLECEVLTTGHVSFTVTDDEADHAIRVCKNGPEVIEAVDRLIMEFHP